MILTFLAAVTAGLGAAAEPVGLSKWSNLWNYPGASSLSGWARVEVTIDETGAAVRCEVVASSGAPKFDKAACDIPLRHGHFKPARDEAGREVFGTWHQTFASGGMAKPEGDTDLSVAVSRVPGSGQPVAGVRLVTSDTGQVESCVVETSSGTPQLDRIACNMVATASLPPVRDAAGVPLRAVRPTRIGFTATR